MDTTTTFVQTAEVKNKYEGKFTHIEEFNRKFEARLKQRNPMAMEIITGQIKLKPLKTKSRTVWEHATTILTSFFLAIQIMLTVDPTTIQYNQGGYTRPQFQTAYDILTDTNEPVDQRVHELWRRINTNEAQQGQTTPTTTTTKEGENSEAETPIRPTRPQTNEQIDSEALDKIVKHMTRLESETARQKRLDEGNFTSNEYVEYGLLKFKSNGDKEEFIRTGIIPTRFITEAMAAIDQTIQETVSAKVLRDKRYIQTNGKQKSGLEIYRSLQTPHDNVIMNCMYLHKKIDELTDEEARVPASYFQKLVLLRQRLDEEMSNLNSTLEKYEIQSMLDTVNKFKQSTAGQAAKQALLQRDFKAFKNVEEYKNLLTQITMSEPRDRPTPRISTNQTNERRTDRRGRPIKCAACAKNHYLNECKNEAKKAELRERDPETYNRFIKFPKCKFGQNCKNKDTCKYDHSTKTNQTNVMVGHTRAIKTNQTTSVSTAKEQWILDSGSGGHIKNNKNNVTNIRHENYVLQTQSGSIATTEVADAGKIKDVIINEAGDVSILSQIKWLRQNPEKATITTELAAYDISLDKIQHLINEAEMMAKVNEDDMFQLTPEFLKTQDIKVHNVKPKKIAQLKHEQLGHASPETMLKMNQNGLLDLSKSEINELRNHPCKGCQENTKNKVHSNHPRRNANERNARRANLTGHFHGDIAKLTDDGKYTAMHVFVDHKTRYTHTIFDNHMKPNSEIAIENLQTLKTTIQKYGHKFRSLRYDKESGYIGKEAQRWYDTQEPPIKLAISRASEQNIAESKIAVLRDRANKMMHHCNLPSFYYPYAYRYACQLTNLLPTDALGGRTPFQEYHNASPYNNIARCKVFGAVAYYRRPELSKHDKAEPCIFLGFDDIKARNYWIFSTQTKRIITVNEANFVETQLPANWYDNVLKGNALTYQGENSQRDTPIPDLIDSDDDEFESDDDEDESVDEDDTALERRALPPETLTQPETNTQPEICHTNGYSPKKTRSGKTYQTGITNHKTMIRAQYPGKYAIKIPKNRKEMLKHEYAEEFKIAEEIELETIHDKGTIKYVENSPEIRHKLKTRMVYDIKSDNDGNITKFKARLVVLGFEQRENEYYETYAPVSQWATILILMLVGWYHGMSIYCMDFKGAYLHAERPADIPVYLKNVGHVEIPTGTVPLLVKSLYGLKDAGNLWRKEVHELLIDLGFQQSKNDPCLYIRRRNGYNTYVATWVDDLIIATNEPNPEEIKTHSEEKGYEISLFEKIDKYLGVRWEISSEEFKFNQKEYIHKILTNTNMQDCKGVRTPMNTKPSYHDTPGGKYEMINRLLQDGEISNNEAKKRREEVFEEIRYMKKVPYRSVIGALSHLARRARPDIQFAVFYHARYQNDPGKAHWTGLKRILRYLKHSVEYFTEARRDAPWLFAACDSDLAGGDQSKSTTGVSIQVKNVSVVSKSRIQRMTAKSSTEAELIALVDAVEECVWAKYLLLDFGVNITPTIYCDNQPAIDTIKNQKLVKGNKHIARRYHFVKGYYEEGIINIEYVPTSDNIADLYTKALAPPAFERHVNSILKTD